VTANTLQTAQDTTTVPRGRGGILLYFRTQAYQANKSVIEQNTIKGFFASVNDNCWGNPNSCNLIRSNQLQSIYHRQAGGIYGGQIAGNVNAQNPTTAVTPIAY